MSDSRMLLCLVTAFCIGCGTQTTSPSQPIVHDTTPSSAEPDDSEVDYSEETNQARTRQFDFHYRFELTGLAEGQKIRVWMPIPGSSEDQEIEKLPERMPGKPSVHTDAKYGNEILYVETVATKDGKLEFDAPYRVTRKELSTLGQEPPSMLESLGESSRKLFLGANEKVPTDGKPLELLKDIQLTGKVVDKAKQLYEIVDSHVAYDKAGEGWGQGDVLWVCDSGRGNCTDFHSLFISLARSQNIPARFEIGFPIPTDEAEGKVGGYHCWALFHDAELGWVPVDISEADKHPELKAYYFGNLTENRVTFSQRRDVNLVPRQAGAPLNYFVYPYAEIDGKPVEKSHIKTDFSWRDRKPAT